jgi:hypothetical protein
MMDNLSHILRRLLTMIEAPSTNSHFGGVTPFKVQNNFDIPLFEGQINVDALKNGYSARGLFLYSKSFKQ